MRIILAISLYFAIALCESVQKDELDVIIQKYIEVQQKNIHSLIKKQAAGEDNKNNRIKDSFEFSIQIPAPEIDYDLIENTVIRHWIIPSRRPWGWWLTTTVPTTERSKISRTTRSTTSTTRRLTTRRTTRATTPRSTKQTTRRTTRTTTPRSTTIRTSRSTTRKRTTSRKTTETPETTQTLTYAQNIPTTSKKTTYSYSRPTRTTTKRRTTTTLKPLVDDMYDYVNFYDWVTKDGAAMNLNQIGLIK